MQEMSTFPEGPSTPKDTHRGLEEHDEGYSWRDSSRVHTSSENNNDEEFKEGHSSLMRTGSNKKNQQQQLPPKEAHYGQRYASKENDAKESSQTSSHSQQKPTLVTSSQGSTPKDRALNHEGSYPLHQQQSSTKISTPQQNTTKPHHLPEQQLLAATKEKPIESSYNSPHQQPSGRVHSPLKDNCPQQHNESSDHSKQQISLVPAPPKYNYQPNNQSSYQFHKQPSPATTPTPSKYHSHLWHDESSYNSKRQTSLVSAPPTTDHPQPSNPSSYQSHEQPSQVIAPSPPQQRCLSGDGYAATSQNSKNLQQQKPSDCSVGKPPKQVHSPKYSTSPTRELSNASCVQQDNTITYDPRTSQSPSVKDPSMPGHANTNHQNIGTPKDYSSADNFTKPNVESSPKNVRVKRTNQEESPSCCCLSVL